MERVGDEPRRRRRRRDLARGAYHRELFGLMVRARGGPFLLAVCLIAIAPGACASCPDRVPPIYPLSLDPDEAVEVILERTSGIRSLRAVLSIRSERGSLKGYLWAESDGRIRILARRLFFNALDLLIDGDRVLLHMPRRGKVLRASISELGAKGAPLLASRDLLEALLGTYGGGTASYKDDETLVVQRPAEGRREAWTYDRSHLLLRHVRRDGPGGEREVEIDVGSYREIDGVWWPGTARLRTPEKEMEIELRGITLNPILAADTFRIELPDDVTVVSRMEDLDP